MALDRVRRTAAPVAAQAELEQEVSAMGMLDVVVVELADQTRGSITKRSAVIDGQRYEVTTWGGGLADICATKRLRACHLIWLVTP